MLQGWFGSDAPLGQDLVVADVTVHPDGSVTLPSPLLPKQQGAANTNAVRVEQHLRMDWFLSPPTMEPPEIIASQILLQLSKQVCPHGFPLAAHRESRQKGCSQPAGPSHRSLGEIPSSYCRL